MRRTMHVLVDRRGEEADKAFTRIELLAISVAIGLLTLLLLPALATNKSDAERMVCFNNLRLVGRGVQVWAGDHNQQFSWRTPNIDGGTLPTLGSSKPGNVWFEYWNMTNELVTPRILACPADLGVNRAVNWLQFGSSFFRNSAVSYSLSLDGSIDFPRTWLSADHNFRASIAGGCSALINNAWGYDTFGGSFPWTNAVHGSFGHALFTDGTVEFTSSERLREILIRPPVDDNGTAHFLPGRQ